MAVLKNIVLAASLLAPIVAAIPMVGPNKRDIFTNTVTEVVWTTIEETTTVWIDPAAPTPPPQADVTATTSTTPAPIVAQATWTPSTMATVAAPEAPSSPAYTPPAAAPSAAPAEAYTVPAAPAVSPSSSPAPAPQASPATIQGKDTVTNGGCTGAGDACSGDVTHWDGGLGACGWNVNTASDLQIALPFEFMGTQSNGNPYCGRSVTLLNPTTGTTVQATVGDKCMGCTGRSIDCTDALFNAIVPGGDGRVSGIQWWLN